MIIDSLASNSFIRYILQPTRLASHSKTLINNIFSNVISHEVISGNLIATIPAGTQRPEDISLWSYFGQEVSDHNKTKIGRIRFLTYFGSAMYSITNF